MPFLRSRLRAALIVLELLAAAAVLLFHAPIPQDLAYHHFADQRSMLGIPNFWNVVSNLPFLLVGLWGIRISAAPSAGVFTDRTEKWAYLVLFVGVTLTCFGSGYYHWTPDNDSLVWDRLPMTIGFMGVLAATVNERVSVRLGDALLGPLILLGISSVIYWHITEQAHRGDLRLYAIVQFGSLLVILTLTLLYPARYTLSAWLFATVGFYVLAKLLEAFDEPVYRTLKVISGHSLKHVAAAAALVPILYMLSKREALSTKGS